MQAQRLFRRLQPFSQIQRLLKMSAAPTTNGQPPLVSSLESATRSLRNLTTQPTTLTMPAVAVNRAPEPMTLKQVVNNGASAAFYEVLLSNAENVMTIQHGSDKVEIPLIWLRDSCTCKECMESTSQRRSWSIWMDAKLREADISDGVIRAVWTDGHRSEHQLGEVLNLFQPDRSPPLVPRETWNRQTWNNRLERKPLPVISHEEVLTDTGLKRLLTAIHKYGFGLVNNCEATEAATEALIRRVAPPMPTTFSPGMWTFTSNMERNDTAYSSGYLAPHTDITYFANPARIQVFHCVDRGDDCTGGESIMVDGFQCADILRRENPSAFATLSSVAQECIYTEPNICYKWTDTVFTQSKVGPWLQRVRFNMYDRSTAPPLCPTSDAERFYGALKAYADLTQHRSNQLMLTLVPGVVVFFDNWRVLHGRTAFTGKRVMTGCYMDNDEFNHACRKFNIIS